jgi:hypothetical protein
LPKASVQVGLGMQPVVFPNRASGWSLNCKPTERNTNFHAGRIAVVGLDPCILKLIPLLHHDVHAGLDVLGVVDGDLGLALITEGRCLPMTTMAWARDNCAPWQISPRLTMATHAKNLRRIEFVDIGKPLRWAERRNTHSRQREVTERTVSRTGLASRRRGSAACCSWIDIETADCYAAATSLLCGLCNKVQFHLGARPSSHGRTDNPMHVQRRDQRAELCCIPRPDDPACGRRNMDTGGLSADQRQAQIHEPLTTARGANHLAEGLGVLNRGR